MNGVNLQASMHNLSQMDRHQHEVHRAPVENQVQNADAEREQAARRVDMPVELVLRLLTMERGVSLYGYKFRAIRERI